MKRIIKGMRNFLLVGEMDGTIVKYIRQQPEEKKERQKSDAQPVQQQQKKSDIGNDSERKLPECRVMLRRLADQEVANSIVGIQPQTNTPKELVAIPDRKSANEISLLIELDKFVVKSQQF